MRLPPCVFSVSVCLAATGDYSTAFLTPVPGLSFSRTTSLATRGHHRSPLARTNARYTSARVLPIPLAVSATSTMSLGAEPSDAQRRSSQAGSKLAAVFRAAEALFRRGGRLSWQPHQELVDRNAQSPNGDHGAVGMERNNLPRSSSEMRRTPRVTGAYKRRQRSTARLGERGWVRRTMAGAAAAMIIRTSFSPSAVSAVPMLGSGRRSYQQQVGAFTVYTRVLHKLEQTEPLCSTVQYSQYNPRAVGITPVILVPISC